MKKFLAILSFLLIFPLTAFACNTHQATFARLSLQYASLANDLGITGGNITISAWVMWTEDPLLLFNESFVQQSDAGVDVLYELQAESNPDGITCRRDRGSVVSNNATYSFTPDINAWFHYVCIYDGTDIKLFLTSTTTHGQYASAASSGNGTAGYNDIIQLGARDDAGVKSRYAQAKMDDVRIYNAALSIATIDANFKQEVSCSDTNLVAYYKLNNDWNDCTSGAFNLTATNSPTFGTDVAFNDCTSAAIRSDDEWWEFFITQ